MKPYESTCPLRQPFEAGEAEQSSCAKEQEKPMGYEGFLPQYFDAAAIGGCQIIVPGEDVIFNVASAQTGGFFFAPPDTRITILETGDYHFTYGVTLQAPENAAYGVTINGQEFPLSRFGSVLEGGGERACITGDFIASIPADSVITLRSRGEMETTLTGTGSGGDGLTRAYMMIRRVG